jgi:hypothetical protein
MAVRRHYAEHRYGSMVLASRASGTTRFFVLIMEWDDLFVLRHWDRRDGPRVEIGPDEAGSAEVRQVVEASVPLPREGALLGWVSGQRVQAVLAAYGRLPEPWDDASAAPGVLVMPLVGSPTAGWPPFAARPLDDGRLWTHLARGQLIDVGPLVTRWPGYVFLVPGGDGAPGPRLAGTRVVVTERLSTEEWWLPAGVYADHWTLREGTPTMTASQLLALPGVIDLAGGNGQRLLGV